MPKFLTMLDPRPWIALAVVAAVLFCIVKYKDAINETTKLKAQISQDQAEATANTLENERLMSRSLAAIASNHQKEMQDEKDKQDKFISGVRNGTVRLSIPVKACPTSAGANSAPGPGDIPETRAELTPTAGNALAAIATDGDNAIRQLNACIDSYQAIRTVINVQAK
ncbi:lysis system i-spanin subunit Rz [Undibacterium sp. Ji42W]|uniref:lysis system i-spanin subunit Rz n=1 Tax=Undibacterium sp. Ji42W TaxID=3413039 RepID=UPI003BF2D923